MSIPEYIDYYNASLRNINLYVQDIIINPSGTKLYASCDSKIISINIVNIDASGYGIKTIAGSFANQGFYDSSGIRAVFQAPVGLIMDTSGNLFVADAVNNNIRKIDISGNVTIFAGDPTGNYGSADYSGTDATFFNPQYLAIDASNNIYVTDRGNYKIRKITSSRNVTTFAGSGAVGSYDDNEDNGDASMALFTADIAGITCDPFGNVYVCEGVRIRKIDSSGNVTTHINSSGASYSNLTSDASGNLYVSDTNRSIIEKILPDGTASIFAGAYNDVLAIEDPSDLSLNIYSDMDILAKFNQPRSITKHPNGNFFLLDTTQITDRPYTALKMLTKITQKPTNILTVELSGIGANSFTLTWTGGTYSRSYVFTMTLNNNTDELTPLTYDLRLKTATFIAVGVGAPPSTYIIGVKGVNTYGSTNILTVSVTLSGDGSPSHV